MEAIKLQKKYPQFTQTEVMSLVSRFRSVTPKTLTNYVIRMLNPS